MSDLNRVVLSGRLTRDPELRYSGSGTAILGFTLASNTYTGKEKDSVLFLDCNMFGKRAEALQSRLQKGQRVIVEGKLVLNAWTTQDGDKRQKIRAVIDNLFFAERKRGTGSVDDFEDDIPWEG